MVTDH
jgi:hypothetical protein